MPARTVADYEDHLSVEDTLGRNEGVREEDRGEKWREIICPPSASHLPPYPLCLPPFHPQESEKNIFFLETSCAPTLNAKMACAVESAATHHPDHIVHLALTTTHVSGTDQVLHTLAALPNTRLTTFNPAITLSPTHPLGAWFRDGHWAHNADWAVVTLSDVVRLVVVCLVGGMYLDLDLISNGAFRLPRGHWLCGSAEREVMAGYDSEVWGSSGPKALQRALSDYCPTTNISTLTRCGDLDLLVPKALYPINYREWERIFSPGAAGVKWNHPSETLALHLWNKFSATINLKPGDRSIVDQVAQNNCPKVYHLLQNVNKLKERLRSSQRKWNHQLHPHVKDGEAKQG